MICGASWEILIVLEDLVRGKVKLWWIMEVKRKGNLINLFKTWDWRTYL